eukprot:TRINITY_DN15233_c0_g4_i1.p1 TRINITY_DN15233_c0_g4~~TRINITY_DN15233_c0_g4_i1.p1  ORF type:complete len:399 (+),score=21.66 TRINITY_DN15233_c0_g4_i1:179-1198(+)
MESPEIMRAARRLKSLRADVSGSSDSSKLICVLEYVFPSIRALYIQGLTKMPSSCSNAWQSSLFGADLEFAERPGLIRGRIDDIDFELPKLVCGWTNVRVLGVSGPFTRLPACLREIKQLTELKVVGCAFRGPDALPTELADLKELRSFHAFTQGVEQRGCPAKDEPEREKCRLEVPFLIGDVGDDDELMWQCPWDSWHFDFGDTSLPHWEWKSIEKFHVDQNRIYGIIPDEIAIRWPHLRSLDLHGNDMAGKLPVSLTRLKNLTQLQLSHNDFFCGDTKDEKNVVQSLYELPLMRTLNVPQNPRLCGCRPSWSKIETETGGTEIKLCADTDARVSTEL